MKRAIERNGRFAGRATPIKYVVLLFSLMWLQWGSGQNSHFSGFTDTTDIRLERLIHQYLSSLDSADQKVNQLVAEARIDHGAGHPVTALQKLQIALVLEDQPTVSVRTRFDLYHTLGDQTYRFHPTYADVFYRKAVLMALEGGVDADRMFVLLTNRAGLLAQLGQMDSAAWYFKLAIDVAPKVSNIAHASAHNNLGVFYEARGEPDAAEALYRKALSVLGSPDLEVILYCSIRDNLASVARHRKAYMFMDSVYAFNDSVFKSLALSNRYLINGVRWLDLRIRQGRPDIEPMIGWLDAWATDCEEDIRPEEILKLYMTAADYYAGKGDLQKHRDYMERYRKLRDHIESEALAQTFILTSGLMDVQEIHFHRELAFQAELNRQKQGRLRLAVVLFVTLAVASGLVILFLGLLIRNRQQKHEALKSASEAGIRAREMEARLIEQELRHKEKDLTQVVLHNTHVHDNQAQWIVRLQALQQERPESIYSSIRTLIHDLEAENRLGTDLISIQSRLSEVNDAFYTRLQVRFPELSKSERELCGYLRIRLTTKDIALLRNVEAASVKMAKNRLRKKLGINPEDDLYEFIQAV